VLLLAAAGLIALPLVGPRLVDAYVKPVHKRLISGCRHAVSGCGCGCDRVAGDRRADRLQKLCAQLGGGEHAVAVGADLAVGEDRDRLAARINELDAEVDILVNNAGLGIYTKFGAEGRGGCPGSRRT
jgi:hypothetical protein